MINPQNYWGDNIRSTTLSYNHEWTPKFMTTTNLSNLVYKMDNNSNMGVTFIDNTDQVYRYAASRDILFEQLFTVMPAKGLEIMSGLTYQYSGNLPQTIFWIPLSGNISTAFSVQKSICLILLQITSDSIQLCIITFHFSHKPIIPTNHSGSWEVWGWIITQHYGMKLSQKKTRLRASILWTAEQVSEFGKVLRL